MAYMSFKTNKLEVTSAEMLSSKVLSLACHVLSKGEHIQHLPSFEDPLKLTAVKYLSNRKQTKLPKALNIAL